MTTDITELAQKPTRYGTNSQGVFTNQTDGAYVSYLDFMALVEALEKAQLVDDELCKLLPPGVEYMDPPDGGDVTPLEQVRRMVADYRGRIADLGREVTRLQSLKTVNAALQEAQSEFHRGYSCGYKDASLEPRTVTVEPFRSFVTDTDLAALHRFAECCDDPESGGHDLKKEQVRRLEEIGALRRSGRVHWITGFGDVLISITAGIKWEAE